MTQVFLIRLDGRVHDRLRLHAAATMAYMDDCSESHR